MAKVSRERHKITQEDFTPVPICHQEFKEIPKTPAPKKKRSKENSSFDKITKQAIKEFLPLLMKIK